MKESTFEEFVSTIRKYRQEKNQAMLKHVLRVFTELLLDEQNKKRLSTLYAKELKR
jgi:hypothetical protein